MFLIIKAIPYWIIQLCSIITVKSGENFPLLSGEIFPVISKKNYSKPTAQALITAGFLVDDIDRIEIHCDPDNGKSAKIPEKLGFTLECIRKRVNTDVPGKFKDSMVWTLFKTDFKFFTDRQLLKMYNAGGLLI